LNGTHRNARIGSLAWGGLAALCLVLFMLAREQERAVLTEQVTDAERRALLYADTVLYHTLDAPAVSEPITGEAYRFLVDAVEGELLDDPRIARVRLWAPDGTLLFSSAAGERAKIGRLRVNQDPAITAASGGEVTSRIATSRFSTSGAEDRGTETDLFETFLPLRVPDGTGVLGAVQIDQFFDSLRSTAATGSSKTTQWMYVGLAVLFGVLTVLSIRRRHPESDVAPASNTARADPAAELVRRNGELELAVEALRADLTTARSALEQAGREASDARLEAQTATDGASAARSALDAQAFELLEARLIDAEDRAAEAERRLAELGLEGPPVGSDGHSARPPVELAMPTGGLVPTSEVDLSAELPRAEETAEAADEPDEPAEAPDEPAEAPDDEPDEGLGQLVTPLTAEAAELRARLARTTERRKRVAGP
jgi:hypothetical protein